jgi:hypothetical protein
MLHTREVAGSNPAAPILRKACTAAVFYRASWQLLGRDSHPAGDDELMLDQVYINHLQPWAHARSGLGAQPQGQRCRTYLRLGVGQDAGRQ